MTTETETPEDLFTEMPTAIRDAVAGAMQRANTFLQAPQDCPRRGCRSTGKCQLRWTGEMRFDCGAGLSVLGYEIGKMCIDTLTDFITPLQPGLATTSHYADQWQKHSYLIEEQLEARRKAEKKPYWPK